MLHRILECLSIAIIAAYFWRVGRRQDARKRLEREDAVDRGFPVVPRKDDDPPESP